MKEITVAGGGLAGLALAMALGQRGVPVRVREAGHYPRHRVCGEFISGVSMETLEFLGLTDLVADARRHHSLAWIEGGRTLHRDRLPDPALGISRWVLDERMQQRVAELGGEVHAGERASCEPGEGRVWAAGRRPSPRSRWIGLKAHLRGLPMTADLELHLGSNGYAGLCGIEDGWVNVCGLFRIDRSLAASREDMLAAYLEAGRNCGLAREVRAAEVRAGSLCAVAGFEFGRQPRVPGLVCLGDASSLIPPFTGNGMSMAFQAAETACDPLVAWATGGRSWAVAARDVQAALERRFRKRLLASRVMHQVLWQPVGRVAFAGLSRLGLLPFQTLLSMVR
jgi:2-polyprenyl-6-methoxyphenol hydroxylase-like FAD-dependent oxidoreductase